jgi:tryptophan synthase beta chain
MSVSMYFGEYGGRYVPEMLQGALDELTTTYDSLKSDPEFIHELQDLQAHYNNRPTPLVEANRFAEAIGSKAQIFLKNEGLNHTGAHKINHCLGQALVAKHLGKTRLIADTGAGQHGLATATVAARFGMKCTIYMGAEDVDRQRPNVLLMGLLGAEVVAVHDGSRTLKDAVSAGIRDWMKSSETTHFVIGSCVGPDPYPRMNRDFQAIVGKEIREQLGDRTPTTVIACVGGGSNALGAFYDFLNDKKVTLVGVEAGGKGKKSGQHASRFPDGKPGVFEGYKTYFLQDRSGNSSATHSIAAGLDYIGIGPELAALHDSGRVQFVSATDKEALKAVEVLARTEGIIPAMESAHAVAHAIKFAPTLKPDDILVINVSGRGDKDIFILGRERGDESYAKFLRDEAQRLKERL